MDDIKCTCMEMTFSKCVVVLDLTCKVGRPAVRLLSQLEQNETKRSSAETMKEKRICRVNLPTCDK